MVGGGVDNSTVELMVVEAVVVVVAEEARDRRRERVEVLNGEGV